ncbi:MgtC/SapB family protein [Dyadobacter sandarakinus]|uniref:MgtC/SapB family protein n=2 Tax=Dyadobacter sandarakinus TaxID=2747268 RepID=A0ABX7ICZ7_9BACT|nr:MgtC/SapB family protein [Dyadobacter sandarakinus]
MLHWSEIAIRLGLAAVLGAVIGLERERKDWTAGMRTHMMVCVGSALSMIVSAHGFGDVLSHPGVELDPSRVASQVVSGIGFIGAGTILYLKQGIIKGLTTASGLWTVAAIGLATGGGMYFAAGLTTGIAIIILLIMQPLEKRLSQRFRHKTVRITTTLESSPSHILKQVLNNENVSVASFTFDRNDEEFVIQIRFEDVNVPQMTTIVDSLQSEPQIKEIFWTK